jgi:hypothetical protein
MSQLAPTACSDTYPAPCGAPVRVLDEWWDARGGVFVATLMCDAGHRWVDMRSESAARPHTWQGQQRLPFVSPTTKRSRTDDDE